MELRDTVKGLMGRAKDDLAELVSFRSVADPKQYPPEECEKAAQWVIDAFTEVGLQDVTASPTPDGSKCVHGHAPGPEVRRPCSCTATTTCSRRSARTRGRHRSGS
jgi:acetylornithine deacetylase/succinyl-diaminopimelate desuccinylase-like protein